eukprot:15478475-Alexandrium_andersonii.AAC.1
MKRSPPSPRQRPRRGRRLEGSAALHVAERALRAPLVFEEGRKEPGAKDWLFERASSFSMGGKTTRTTR